MNNISIKFNVIITNLEDNSRLKLEKINADINQFAKDFDIFHPGVNFYSHIEAIARTIYSWRAEGTWGGYTIFEYKFACSQLEIIQNDYDSFNFTINNNFDEITNKLELYLNPVDKCNAINEMLADRYAQNVYTLSEEKRSINLAEINLLIELRNYVKTLIDAVIIHPSIETEIVYREVCSEQIVHKKSKVLKIIVEDDVNVKLYDDLYDGLSHSLDHSEIQLCRRKDFGPSGNFDIVITKDIKNVVGRQIHFKPCNAKKLIALLESIVKKDVKRAKFIQAIKPNAWYNNLVGKEFFINVDDYDRPVALMVEPKNVWEIDSRLLKDKYVDVLSVTQTKKIESKQIPKGSVVEWD